MNHASSVEQLLSMTQEIGRAASLADWPEAARLTEARSSLLMTLSAQQEPAALEMIHKIQSIDATIVADAKATQVELEIEYREAMRRTSAMKEYHRVALL